MSDSEHSSVIYTSVPSPVEDYSDIGSPEVDGPPSPDYVPGPEEPEQAPLSPDYVPGPEDPEQAPPLPIYLPYVPELVYPEYMPPEDDVFPAEEQPLPVAATPTADSPGYIPEFDPKGNLEEDDEEDPEEDPADYPADSTVVALPAVDHIPSEEEVEESSAAGAARQDEPVVARDDPYSLLREELYGFFNRVDVTPGRPMSRELDYGITDTWDELVRAIKEIAPTTLQGACSSSFSSYDRERLGWLVRLGDYPWMLATMHVQMLCHYVLRYILEFDPKRDLEEEDEEDPKEDPADSTVVALPVVDHVPSEETPESCIPLWKRLRFASLIPSQEVRESSAAGAARQDESAVARDDHYSLVREELYGFVDRVDVAPRRLMSKELDYGITDTWEELVGATEEIAPTTLQGVNQRVTDLSTVVEHETTIMYGMMEEAQDDQS
nr:hypothetical protein [Tanacetum cinerariifolium]